MASIPESFHGERTIFMRLRKPHRLRRKGLASWKFAARRTKFTKFAKFTAREKVPTSVKASLPQTRQGQRLLSPLAFQGLFIFHCFG